MAHELAHSALRHADHDDHRNACRRYLDAGNFAFFFGGNRDNNNPLGFVGVLWR